MGLGGMGKKKGGKPAPKDEDEDSNDDEDVEEVMSKGVAGMGVGGKGGSPAAPFNFQAAGKGATPGQAGGFSFGGGGAPAFNFPQVRSRLQSTGGGGLHPVWFAASGHLRPRALAGVIKGERQRGRDGGKSGRFHPDGPANMRWDSARFRVGEARGVGVCRG